MQIAEQYMELLNLHLGSRKLKQAESVQMRNQNGSTSVDTRVIKLLKDWNHPLIDQEIAGL